MFLLKLFMAETINGKNNFMNIHLSPFLTHPLSFLQWTGAGEDLFSSASLAHRMRIRTFRAWWVKIPKVWQLD